MSRIVLVAVFCVFAGCVHAQTENVRMETQKKYFVTEEDTDIEMKCMTDAIATFLITKQLRFVHISAKTETETIVSEQGSLMSPYSDMGDIYELDFQVTPTVYAVLKLKKVQPEMDGTYKCEIKPLNEDTILESDYTDVTVLGGVTSLTMDVDQTRITEEMTDTLKFREQDIKVTCSASGTNPRPAIHLHLGDKMLPADINVMKNPDSPIKRRSFEGSVEYTIKFTSDLFGQKLMCHAETDLPEGAKDKKVPDMTVSVKLEGILDAPLIECSNNTAGTNDRKITLSCRVSKKPDLKSVVFNVGNRYILGPGNKSKDYTEVTKKNFNGTFDEYTLQFYEMKDWHFTADIYFDVKAADGKMYQKFVYLIKGEDNDISGASSARVALMVPAICLLALTLLRSFV